MLRYMKSKNLSSPKLIATWIDQAHIYYRDSIHSDWRSAGLLYYYSFLNLAKALLVGKRRFSYKALDTTATHHGLSADLQDISSLIDFQIQIFPPSVKTYKNVFSNFYEIVTGSKWHYQNAVMLKLKDILGYCDDISVESASLFNIRKKTVIVQSMHRENADNMWFEMIVEKSVTDIVKSQLTNWDLQFFDFDEVTPLDRIQWFEAYKKTSSILRNYTFIRTPSKSFTNDNRNEILQSLWKNVRRNLEPYMTTPVYLDVSDPSWHFIPNLDLAWESVPWHPILSNYLMSFALATILRYQPQLLKTGTHSYFYAEAWCSQCSRTTLGNFLMLFTNPPITLQTL